MKIRPKSGIVLDIVEGIHASTQEFIEEEIAKYHVWLLGHGASEAVAKAIINEVRLLL